MATKSSKTASKPAKKAAKTPVAKTKKTRAPVEIVPQIRRAPEAARALILDAAKELLSEHGPDKVGLKLVAERAGVSHALVSYYFGTYDGLVEAALSTHVAEIRAQALENLSKTPIDEPEQAIEALFNAIANPLYGRLLAWAMLTGRLGREDFFPKREQGLRKTADVVEARLRSEGHTLPRDELESLLAMIMLSAFGYLLGRDVIWGALGKSATKERDARFRKTLAQVVRSAMLRPATTD